MVVMSIETYERQLFQNEIYFKLKEAEMQAQSTDVPHAHKDVMQGLRASLNDKGASDA